MKVDCMCPCLSLPQTFLFYEKGSISSAYIDAGSKNKVEIKSKFKINSESAGTSMRHTYLRSSE
jgi:hypothetical protein